MLSESCTQLSQLKSCKNILEWHTIHAYIKPRNLFIMYLYAIYYFLFLYFYRYVAIVKPLHYQQLITPLRAGLILFYIWVHSTVMACLPFFHFAEYSYVKEVGACTINWKTATFGFTIAMNLFCYFIPLLVILICYTEIFLVARKVKRQVKPCNQTRHPSTVERPFMEMDNFSVPANFGMNYDDRQRTIMFRGNVQIAESVHRAHSASTGHLSKADNLAQQRITEEVEEHLQDQNIRTFHNCKIKGEIKFEPILSTIDSIQQTSSKSTTEHNLESKDSGVATQRKLRHLSVDQTFNVKSTLSGSPFIHHKSPTIRQVSKRVTQVPNLEASQDKQLPANNRSGSLRGSFEGMRRKSVRRTLRMQRLRDTKAATTLLILVGAFIVCWTPYVIICFLVQSGRTISSTLYGATFVTALCNSANNVFVYGILNTKFRKGFKHLFQSCWQAFIGEEEDDRPFPNNISQSIKIPAIEVAGQFLQGQRSF